MNPGQQTNLCQGRFVDAVNVWFRLGFNLIPQCFVADCAVDQRLRECTRAEQHKSEQALALNLHISERV